MKNRQLIYLALIILPLFLQAGCASIEGAFSENLNLPPEYNQKVQLIVPDTYEMFQAESGSYDGGDLANFHAQHTLPITVEGVFRQVFGQVEMIQPGQPRLETQEADAAAVFEVRFKDLSHDNYDRNIDFYRAESVIVAVMKNPKGTVFWQKGYRGSGYVQVNPEFERGDGPIEAVKGAVDDALSQLKSDLAKNPRIRLQLQHYAASQQAGEPQEPFKQV